MPRRRIKPTLDKACECCNGSSDLVRLMAGGQDDTQCGTVCALAGSHSQALGCGGATEARSMGADRQHHSLHRVKCPYEWYTIRPAVGAEQAQ